MYRNFLLVFIALMGITTNSVASEFEGKLMFAKQTVYDTTYYLFTVKHKWVRIDEENSRHEVVQSLLVDIENQKVTALSPSQKLYTHIQRTLVDTNRQKEFSIIKTENFKVIDGYKCYLWRLRNTNLNMEVSFWVTALDFGFFTDAISLLSQTEYYSRFCQYFDNVPQAQGFFPVLTVEKTLLREERMKMSVQHILHKRVDDKVFKVPSDYRYLRF